MARNNVTFNLSDIIIKALVNIAQDSIPIVTFAKSLCHTQSVETEYWTRDGLEITPIMDDVLIDTEETDSGSDLLTNQILNIFIRLIFFFFLQS